MKFLALIASLVLLLPACNTQPRPAEASSVIEAQANRMAQSLIKKDYKTFAEYTHPKVVEMMGGKEKMADIMDKNMSEMEAGGTHFAKITIGTPSKTITVGKELQCTVPQSVEMKVPNGKLTTESTLIGVSTDNGEHWTFMDTSGKDMKAVKETFPTISPELVIPEQKKPVFSEE